MGRELIRQLGNWRMLELCFSADQQTMLNFVSLVLLCFMPHDLAESLSF